MSSHAPYEPRAYWKQRLERDFSVGAAGFLGLGAGFNYWIYLRRRQAVRHLLHRHGVTLDDATVADAGVGTGYWIPEWERLGARGITGFDLTEVSVRNLSARYPQYEFVRCDLGDDAGIPAAARRRHTFVVAMDVLLHIVDETQFRHALTNLTQLATDRAHILLSDLFLPVEYRVDHQYSRTLATFEAALGQHGFTLQGTCPVFFLLHPSHLLLHGWRRSLSEFRWAALAKGLRALPTAGWPLGAAAFGYDTARAMMTTRGPSAHLTLWERR